MFIFKKYLKTNSSVSFIVDNLELPTRIEWLNIRNKFKEDIIKTDKKLKTWYNPVFEAIFTIKSYSDSYFIITKSWLSININYSSFEKILDWIFNWDAELLDFDWKKYIRAFFKIKKQWRSILLNLIDFRSEN